MDRSTYKNNLLLYGILALALAVRLWGISFGLPCTDHGDETEVVNHAVRFGSGDLNPHRFQYGSLVQYILFIFYGLYFTVAYCLGLYKSVHEFALAFVRDPSVFYLIARGFSALLGTATVYLAYVLGRRLSDKTTGLLAAGFLALCYQHAVHCHYATVDSALVFFFTLTLHRCLVLYETGALRDYVLAGLFAGLACAVKFNGAFTLLPLLCAHFLRTGTSLSGKIMSKNLMAAFACTLAGHGLASPFFYLEFSSAWKEISALNAMHVGAGFTLPAYVRLLLGPEHWGLPLGLLCLWGVLSAFWRDRRHAILGLSCLSVFFFASRYRYVEGKYILCALPMLSALAASALVKVARSSRPVVLMAAGAALCCSSFLYIVQWDNSRAAPSINLEAQQWIERNIPAQAKILLDNTGNDGPKLANDPANVQRQYERAAARGLLKAEYLKLKAELKPETSYDITLVDDHGGFRQDDYERYCSWADLEKIGMSPAYYRKRGFEFLILTNRYFDKIGKGFILVKEFARLYNQIRIYRVPSRP